MAYTTKTAPCGHNVDRYVLIARTLATASTRRVAHIYRCQDCGELIIQVGHTNAVLSEAAYQHMLKQSIIIEVEN